MPSERGPALDPLPLAAAGEILASPELELGESPRVSPDGHTLWFIDIAAKLLWRVPVARLHDRDAYESRELPLAPGFVQPVAAEAALLGLSDGLYRYDWAAGTAERVWELPDPGVPVRLNDGAVAPDGAVWFGTMNLGEGDPDAGLLFRYADGEAAVIDGPVACWNGIGWSPDGSETYATDTLGLEIRRYSADGAARAGVAVPGAARVGLPDGLLVDASGAVWSAIWDGGEVLRLRDGVPVGTVRVPGARPTAIAELPDGGLVITRAADADGPGRLAGLPAGDVAGLSEAEAALSGPPAAAAAGAAAAAAGPAAGAD